MALISILFLLPIAPAGIPWKAGFDWNVANYAPLTVGGALHPLRRLVACSRRKKWFKGPVRMGTEEELEQLEAKQEGGFVLPADTQYETRRGSVGRRAREGRRQAPLARRSLPHPGAAVLVDRLPGDAARVGREQPGDGARDVVGLPHPPERHGPHRLAVRVLARSPVAAAMPSRPSQAMSVSTQPGQIALTCTLSAPSSAASERTRPSRPAFEAL